jgi:hypothetical protein
MATGYLPLLRSADEALAACLAAFRGVDPTAHRKVRTALRRLLGRFQEVAGTEQIQTSLQSLLTLVETRLVDLKAARFESTGQVGWTALQYRDSTRRKSLDLTGPGLSLVPGAATRTGDMLVVDQDTGDHYRTTSYPTLYDDSVQACVSAVSQWGKQFLE